MVSKARRKKKKRKRGVQIGSPDVFNIYGG